MRVIKRKSKNSPTPDGYVRVIFQTEERNDNPGGSFGKNADNSPRREVVYDVIEGLMSDNIIVPQEKKAGEKPNPNKIYITPDPGRKFIKWDKQRLLNENTVLRSGTPYVFTAYFEWSGLKINDLVRTESFKDGDKWVNNFVPTEDELKGALSWITNGKEGPLPSGVSVTIKEKSDDIYKKVKELDKKDSDELVRTDKVMAEVNFGNGSVQTIEIPVKIYKNVYEALTTGTKPKILVDAEREDLKDITGSYVKVTVDPTGRPNEKDSKIYYVNKNANVVIPEVILSPEEKAKLGFTNWTADKDAQNEGQKENGVFVFAKRHKFTEDTVISPGFAQDVIPQEGKDKPKSVPDYFVKVTFKPTDKATDTSDKIYWVNPNNEVTIYIADPLGKDAYSFIEWKIDGKAYSPKTAKKFDRETVVTADYSKSEDIIEYDPKDPKTKPDGYVRVTFEGEDGLNLSNVKAYFVKKNKNISLFNNENIIFPTVTAKTGYEHNGWDKGDGTLINDQDIIVTAKSKELPNTLEVTPKVTKPDKYVKVTFTTEDASKGQVKEKSYYVNPEKFVKLTPPTVDEITANTGYEFATWDFDATQYQNYKEDKIIKAGFNELDNIYTEAKPGYNLVQFEITGKGGSILTGETVEYYVKPNAKVKVPAPKVVEEIGYKFSGWSSDPNEERVYSESLTKIKGTFTKLADIVPGTDSVKYPGYIEVKFLPGTEGSFTSGETIYYVNPKANKTLANLTKPSAKGNTGYKFEGKWDKEDTTQLTGNIEVTAKYTEVPDVIPKTKEDEPEKPDGYIKVSFTTTEKGKIKDTEKTEKILYVNPNKAVVLDDFKPIVTANTGYTHAGWDISISKAIQYKNNDRITAQYNELGNIFKEEKPGYVKVIFDKGENGNLEGQTEYWIKLGYEVKVPEPKVNPYTGYKFNEWDKSTTITAKAGDGPINIKALYTPLDDIIDGDQAQPKGYVEVIFVADGNGNLSGARKFWVKPNTQVDLTKKANAISKNPNLGYTEENGSWDKSLSGSFNQATTITFKFKELPKIIPAEPTTEKPKGYVNVEFITDGNGTLTGTTKYFVNPDGSVKLGESGLTIPQPTGNPNYNFAYWSESINKKEGITGDKIFVAHFKTDKVTLTYKADDATQGQDSIPNPVTVNVGTSVDLANARALKKNNFNFEGWKIGESENDLENKIYKPGDSIKLEKNMVAVAQWSNQKANVSYQFVSADPGKTLPQEVLAQLPKVAEKNVGEIAIPQAKNSFKNVVISTGEDQGTWSFTSWNKENLKVSQNNNIFIGKWTFTGQGQVSVTYNYTYKNESPSSEVEGQIEGTKPQASNVFIGSTVKAPKNINKTFADTIDRKQGTWKFKSWDPSTDQNDVKGNISFIGTWTFVEDGQATVDYKFTFIDKVPSPEVLNEINKKLPENKTVYPNTSVEAPENFSESYKDKVDGQTGEWIFITWKPNTDQIVGEKGLTFEGIWKFFKKDETRPLVPVPKPEPERMYIIKPVVHTEIVEKIVEKEVYLTNEVRRQVRYMRGFQNKFRPNDPLTRAEAAQILANALIEDRYNYDKNYKISYTDIKESDWFAKAVKITSQADVFKGYDDGEFKAQKKITRAEWISTLKRFQMLENADGNQMHLKKNHWAMAEIEAAFKEGWLEIYTNKIVEFKADEPITRQEVAAVSNKAFGRLIDEEYIKANEDKLINYKDIDQSMWSYIDILNASNTFLHKERNYKAYKINENSYNIETSKYNISQDAFQRTLR